MTRCVASPSFLRASALSEKRFGAEVLRKHRRSSLRNVARRNRFLIEITPLSKNWNCLEKEILHQCYCNCLGSLADLDGIAAPDFISISDQMLLTASIFLTYFAGIIPGTGLKSSLQENKEYVDDATADTPSSGSISESCVHDSFDTPWSTVKQKLMDAIDGLQHVKDYESIALESLKSDGKRPLSLFAISDGPRMRLLLSTLEVLEDEVTDFFSYNRSLPVDEWVRKLPEVIQNSAHPICTSWLMKELRIEDKNLDDALISSLTAKLEEEDTILKNIQRSGKEVLFGELIYYTKRGSLRLNSTFSEHLFRTYGDTILEDMVIHVADGIATTYMNLISVDGDFVNRGSYLEVALCNLSTRELQKLRNQIALSRWFYQNLEMIASMYEDRFDLHSLKSTTIQSVNDADSLKSRWWSILRLGKSEIPTPSFCHVTIQLVSLPVKRTTELRALTGWRYYYSLYLELLDISTPLIRSIISNFQTAITFFLVSLIGRSLGLIYTGIKQSLRWK